MKKVTLLITMILVVMLVSCSSSTSKTVGFTDSLVGIDLFANDDLITYEASYKYIKERDYFLELSVQIPNKDGTSRKEVLKGSYFKAEEDTNNITDSILIEDVEKILGDENKDKVRNLNYEATIYNVEDGKITEGSGSGRNPFEES